MGNKSLKLVRWNPKPLEASQMKPTVQHRYLQQQHNYFGCIGLVLRQMPLDNMLKVLFAGTHGWAIEVIYKDFVVEEEAPSSIPKELDRLFAFAYLTIGLEEYIFRANHKQYYCLHLIHSYMQAEWDKKIVLVWDDAGNVEVKQYSNSRLHKFIPIFERKFGKQSDSILAKFRQLVVSDRETAMSLIT